MINSYDIFSRRDNFNFALRHFKSTMAFSKQIQDYRVNLADLLEQAIISQEITREQVPPILSAVLVDKFAYAYKSVNLEGQIEDTREIIETLSSWTALNIVLAYFHPEIGVCPINPANEDSWQIALPLKKDELLVVFVGMQNADAQFLQGAVADIHSVIAGRTVSNKEEYVSLSAPSAQRINIISAKEEGSAQKQNKSGYRITPKYSVLVTNELFHNGNVEAWKRIIASYKNSYENIDVFVYYDSERINDLNALFKWGKVKHGRSILFSVAGSQIRDVAKLRKYLFEGASPRFENFLRGSVSSTLELF